MNEKIIISIVFEHTFINILVNYFKKNVCAFGST